MENSHISLFLKFFVYLGLLALAANVYGNEEDKAFFQRAVEYTCEHSTFIIHQVEWNGTPCPGIVLMGKKGLFRRQTYSSEGERTEVLLSVRPQEDNSGNSPCCWIWVEKSQGKPIGERVMEMSIAMPRDLFAFYREQIKSPLLDNATYTLKENSDRIYVTVEYSHSDAAIMNSPGMNFSEYSDAWRKERHDFLRESIGGGLFSHEKEHLQKTYVAKRVWEFGADPKIPFVYGYSEYNMFGEELLTCHFKEVEFPKSINGKLFAIPRKSIIVPTAEYVGYARTYMKLFGPEYDLQPQSRKANIGLFRRCLQLASQDPLRFATECLFWLAIGVAVISFTIGLALKIRQWRQ